MPRQSDLKGSPFQLREAQVTLRPFGRRELMSSEYLRWMNDPEVTRTIGRFDYLLPVSRAKLVAYFREIDTDNTLFLAIHRKGRFVGTLKLYDLDPLARRASLGIMVGPEAWGQGVATAAIRAASRYVFDVLGFAKVGAGYLASNVGMHKAFSRNGFRIEGRLRRQVFFQGRLEDHIFVGKFRNGKR